MNKKKKKETYFEFIERWKKEILEKKKKDIESKLEEIKQGK